MKKSFIAGLAGTLVLGLATSAFAFSDVSSSHWAKKYVDKLAELKVVNGVSETAFNPNGKVTRAEFAKMIVEAKGLDKVNPATATFTDVAADKWFYGYVEAAAKAGYVNGTGEGKFDPNANITRQEIAKIIVEAAGLKADDAKTLTFADAADVSAWAKGYVAVAADKKFVEGYNNKFSPKNNATRAEAAKLTYSEMVYEGKITEEEDKIVGNVISEDVENGDTDVEIGGTLYDLENAVFKIAGEFIDGETDDVELFIKGTPVSVTFGNNDVVKILEGTGKFVEGILETKSNAGSDVFTINGKDYNVIDEDDWKGALDISDITIGSNYKFLFNKDNEIYGAIAVESKRVGGAITAFGVKRVGDDYQYYIKLDTTTYNFKKNSDIDDAKPTDNKISVDGTPDQGWAALSTDLNASIKTDGDGYITKVDAFNKEISGATGTADRGTYATFKKPGNDKTYYLTSILTVKGNVYVGEGTSQSDATENPALGKGDGLVLMLASSATIKQDGTTVKFDKIKSGKYATLTVNSEGIVTAIEVKDETAKGQLEALTMDSSDRLTSVTIGGVKYNFDKDFTKDQAAKNSTVSGRDKFEVAKTVMTLDINNKGEVVGFTSANLIFDGEDDEVTTYTVVATPFAKGRPMDSEATDDTYAAGGTIRVMNSDGDLFIVKPATDAKMVKAGKKVVIGDFKIGDTIATDVALVKDGTKTVNWVVSSPLVDIK